MFSYFLQPFFSHRSAFVLPLFCRNAYQTRAVCGVYVTFSRIPPVSSPHTACEMEGDGEKLFRLNWVICRGKPITMQFYHALIYRQVLKICCFSTMFVLLL